jgi:nucleotide-binding universal stress UspA family protein
MAGFKNLQIEALCVKKQSQSLHLPDNKLLKEYLKRHYPQAVYTVCKGDAEKKIPALLRKEDEGTLVVSGAYNRGYISQWFRPSMADILLSTVKSPLFISPVQ